MSKIKVKSFENYLIQAKKKKFCQSEIIWKYLFNTDSTEINTSVFV